MVTVAEGIRTPLSACKTMSGTQVSLGSEDGLPRLRGLREVDASASPFVLPGDTGTEGDSDGLAKVKVGCRRGTERIFVGHAVTPDELRDNGSAV